MRQHSDLRFCGVEERLRTHESHDASDRSLDMDSLIPVDADEARLTSKDRERAG